MMAGYPWLELADLASAVRERLAAAGPGGLRVTISACVVPVASPHPIEIFAGTLARSRPDPDVGSPLAALKHAFRDDPFDIFEDPHGRPLIYVQTRPA